MFHRLDSKCQFETGSILNHAYILSCILCPNVSRFGCSAGSFVLCAGPIWYRLTDYNIEVGGTNPVQCGDLVYQSSALPLITQLYLSFAWILSLQTSLSKHKGLDPRQTLCLIPGRALHISLCLSPQINDVRKELDRRQIPYHEDTLRPELIEMLKKHLKGVTRAPALSEAAEIFPRYSISLTEPLHDLKVRMRAEAIPKLLRATPKVLRSYWLLANEAAIPS